MTEQTILHTADTHVGYSQYHKEERREDFFDAFKQVIDAAIDRDVSAVVHGGDLFNDSNPSPETFRKVRNQLARLNQHDIPFLTVVGNHDRSHGDVGWLDLLDDMGVLTLLSSTPTVVDGTAFYGIDHTPRTKRPQLDYQFKSHDADRAVLVIHGLLKPLSAGTSWNISEILGTTNIDFDAVLCGDDHEPKTEWINGTPVTYPGSTERTATDQSKPRRYNLARFDGDVTIDHEHLDVRPLVRVPIEMEENMTASTVASRVRNEVVDDSIVHVTLTGEGEVVPQALIEDAATDAGAFICRVTDERVFDTERDIEDVEFADPDSAAQERIADLEITDATRDLEALARDQDEVAKSKLKAEGAEWVEDTLEDDPELFADPSEVTSDTGETSPDDGSPDDDGGESAGADDDADVADSWDEQWDDSAETADTTEAETEEAPSTDDSATAAEDGVAESSADDDTDTDSDGQAALTDW